MELKPCPCGRTNPNVVVTETSKGLAYITCSECCAWSVLAHYAESWEREQREAHYVMCWNAAPMGMAPYVAEKAL